MNNLNKEILLEYYIDKKLSVLEIAKITGVGRTTIYTCLEKYGIKIRSSSDALKNFHNKIYESQKENYEKLIELIKHKYLIEKKSLNKISKEINVSTAQIFRIMKNNGIKTRGRKEAAPRGENHPMFGLRGPETTMYGKRGHLSHMWKGGKNIISEQIRNSYNLIKWREDVYKRDNYTCVICSKRGGKLHVDHIKQLALIIIDNNIKTMEDAYNCKELWDINNGRTMCEECHKKTDTWGKIPTFKFKKMTEM